MHSLRIIASVVLLFGLSVPVSAQNAVTGRLRLVVLDPSGAVIPGALVRVAGAEDHNRSVTRADLVSTEEGVVEAEGLPPGRYNIEVAFEGFETVGVLGLRIRANETMRREVELPIRRQEESVAVGRDPAENAADPNSGRFDTVLSREQIDAMPDDPDEMQALLEEMAGPGASLRVDGFRGGKLPPKDQIRSIRISRDPFAAENHGGGMVHIDVVTQPGMGPLRGGMNFTFADDALNARTATQPVKGDERNQMFGLNLSGTIARQKTGFSLSANGSSNYNASEVFAQTLDGSVAFSQRQPSETFSFNGRIDHAVSASHTLRANIMLNESERNGGIGGFNLAQQGTTMTSQSGTLRLSDSGSWGRSLFNETRLQIGRNTSRNRAAFEGQTVRVLDSFTGGGAQTRGGRDTTTIELASNLDYARGKHAFRAGFLLEGDLVTSDQQSNYLGTFTFASLQDYAAGRPSTFTRRDGDPLVEYSQWQAGLFVQDDWRVRPNLTLSMGVRQEVQTNLDDRINVSPRFGLSWSPSKNGKTILRGSAGVFYDWLETQTFEQVLQVDGVRQVDTVISNPGYPDPLAGGILRRALPGSRYVLADNLSMPYTLRASAGVQRQLTTNLGTNLLYSFSRSYDRFRGRNINAPDPALGGARPDPAFGNITQVESTGGQRQHMMHAGLSFNLPAKRVFLFLNYTLNHTENDANGPFGLPADNYDLAAEWGRAPGVARHSLNGNMSTRLFGRINLNLNTSLRSGMPYNITTGRDSNGDTVFNDRPAGVGRNSATGDATFTMGGQLSYQFGFGRRSGAEGGAGGTTVIIRSDGADGGGGGAAMSAGGGEQVMMMRGDGPRGNNSSRYTINLFVRGQNLLNAVNPQGYAGVMTSPLFGRPTGAQRARSVNVGVRVGF